MSNTLILPGFRFLKVGDFFADIDSWDSVEAVTGHRFDAENQELHLLTQATGDLKPLVLIQFVRAGLFRLRFNPDKSERGHHSQANSRTIVMDSFDDLLETMPDFEVDFEAGEDELTLITRQGTTRRMKLVVKLRPYSLEIYNFESRGAQGEQVVMVARDTGILFRRIEVAGWNDQHDWAIILQREKFPFTKYLGFGEKGGTRLCKNGEQVTYFNFDNMRYRQIYNQGPLDSREPLYDSCPFLFDCTPAPGFSSLMGTFIDNHSQLCLDIGFLRSDRVLLGSSFGDLDMYQIVDQNCEHVLRVLASLIGTTKLKPRYVLGYHQGCYGYETRDILLGIADEYRQAQFPIDGLHIDVDIQERYCTFTVNENGPFRDARDMFVKLRERGYKCSTNITPIISNKNENYQTYTEGLRQNYFINDVRALSHPNQTEDLQNFEGGDEKINRRTTSQIGTGAPFEGEVYYGTDPNGVDRGTPGHYADLARKEVRRWWGQQYQPLFDLGLEFVWQDMTSPCIRPTRGDMRSLPFGLLVSDDSVRKFDDLDDEASAPPKSPAVKIRSLYAYNLHKATYHGLNNLRGRENKRNFIIGRGGFAGMHRFAGLWTGDNASEWDFLRINVAQVLGLGMSGQSMAGADIGGFETRERDQWVDPELFIRWMIAGAFLPWFRNHYIKKNVKEFQEPYAFERVLNRVPPQDHFIYRSVLPVTKYYVELRYRLLQLLYDCMFENTLTGMPICRPLFLHEQADIALFADKIAFLDNEFLVGRDLLVAPVLEPQSVSQGCRQVYLPTPCSWYLFMNARKPLEAPVRGGSTFRFDAHIDPHPDHIGFIVPMYVRAGAIIPTIELEQWVGQRHAQGVLNPVTLHVFPSRAGFGDPLRENPYSGEYRMYLDDGVSRSSAPARPKEQGGDDAAKGEYRQLNITHSYNRDDLSRRQVVIEVVHDNFEPDEDFVFVGFHHDPAESKGPNGPLSSVKIGGTELSRLTGGTIEDRSSRLWISDQNAFYYHEGSNTTYVKVFYGKQRTVIEAIGISNS